MEIKNLFSNRNIIILAVLSFAAWMLFFDRNNYLDIRNLDEKIESLEQERDYYEERIAQDSAVIVGLQDTSYLEGFARENFFMLRENEKMYILKFE